MIGWEIIGNAGLLKSWLAPHRYAPWEMMAWDPSSIDAGLYISASSAIATTSAHFRFHGAHIRALG
jgi:hypothetical protein